MAAQPPVCEFGCKAPDFSLKGTDGRMHDLSSLKGENGTVIVFICNHCPYVKSIIGRLVETAHKLDALGIGMAAICSNDAQSYPEDDFEHMRAWADQKNFPFPYLHDEDQSVASAYGAVCTPDFFGYNADLELQYRGRLDESRRELVPNARPELLEAMTLVAKTGKGPADQIPSMGCSIKWKAA